MKNVLAAALALLLTTGCFEIDQKIELKQDMSGTADFHLGVDLEPMVVIMAQLAKEMEGKSGPLTAAELEKAKADFRKSKKSESTEQPPREEIARSLPPGVELIDYDMREREFGVDSKFRFSFKKLQNLVDVRLPGKKGSDPTEKNVVETPFEGLEVVDQGKTFTIRTKPQNPTEAVKEEAAGAPKLDADTEKLVRQAFSKMRVSYRITAPFEVVSHNATRVEGKTLVWEYTLETFEKLAAAKPEDAQLRVTFRK